MLVARQGREGLKAAQDEVEEMLQEGIELLPHAAPVRLTGVGGRLSAVECLSVPPAAPAGPRGDTGEPFILPVDVAVIAAGWKAVPSFADDVLAGLGAVEGVFAAGDVVAAPGHVIRAIAAGRQAARAVAAYLRGEPVHAPERARKPERLSDIEAAGLKASVATAARVPMPKLPPDARGGDFREVSAGYATDEAMAEASRCLAGQVEGCIGCGECERRCDAGAIDFNMTDETLHIPVDAIVLAPGFDLYDPTEKREYGYGTLPGVITGIEFERISSVTGPTFGEIIVDGKRPRRFFFIQCVGSRDRQTGARFCSRVCCMYTAKHASIVRERIRDAEVYISYIDVRAYGKGYEEFYKNTQESGAMYIRGVPGEVARGANGLVVRVEDIMSGELREIETDVVVLATGVRPRAGMEELCRLMGVERDGYGFVKVDASAPSLTSAEGIFVCGMASGPKDVPDTVASAGEARRGAWSTSDDEWYQAAFFAPPLLSPPHAPRRLPPSPLLRRLGTRPMYACVRVPACGCSSSPGYPLAGGTFECGLVW
jgi:heterodisulfide reductase subunit A